MTFPEDGPASGKFTKTFMKRDYVVKFVNTFVNGLFLCHDKKTVVSKSFFICCVELAQRSERPTSKMKVVGSILGFDNRKKSTQS